MIEVVYACQKIEICEPYNTLDALNGENFPCSVMQIGLRIRQIIHPKGVVSRNCFRTRAKMSVQEYLEKHDLSKRVEEVINACVKAKPDEPLSFMVRISQYGRTP